MSRYIKEYNVYEKLRIVFHMNPRDVEEFLAEIPNEDVVPRSEVDRWQLKYKNDIEICDNTIHRLHNILLQFTEIVHKWGNKNGIDTTEISLVPILEQEADSIINKAKQDVASKLIRQIREAIMAHGTKYAMKELAKIEKEYIGE